MLCFYNPFLKVFLITKFAKAQNFGVPDGISCVWRKTSAQCHYPNDVLMKTQCQPAEPTGDQVIFFNLFIGGWDQKLL